MADEVIDLYVKSRLEYARKVIAEAAGALEFVREAAFSGEPVTLTKQTYFALSFPLQIYRELAFGLDEAMAALKYYASADTWKEVPDHTLAAQDVGQKARVALARIDPV